MNNKTFVDVNLDIRKQEGLKHGEFIGVMSSMAKDNDGETIDINGIEPRKASNIPLTWLHDYMSIPLGTVKQWWREGNKFVGKFFIDYDLGEFENAIYQKILRGTIGALSIGGKVIERDKNDFNKITKMSWWETAVVPIGANPDALITAKGVKKDVYDDFLKRNFSKKLGEIKGDSLKEYIDTLKNLTSALESSYKDASLATEDKVESNIKSKLVLTHSAAKQCDRQSELILAAIKSKIKEL